MLTKLTKNWNFRVMSAVIAFFVSSSYRASDLTVKSHGTNRIRGAIRG